MIELVIEPRRKDLGGFEVSRVLPFAKRHMVGPFIFFDHMGPANLPPEFHAASMCGPTPISGFPPSPICSMARSCIATVWDRNRPL